MYSLSIKQDVLNGEINRNDNRQFPEPHLETIEPSISLNSLSIVSSRFFHTVKLGI